MMLTFRNCCWLSYVLMLIGTSGGLSNSKVLLRNRRAEVKCASREFTCRSGQCISKFDVCDGRKDCEDGSDENHVTCRDNMKFSLWPKNLKFNDLFKLHSFEKSAAITLRFPKKFRCPKNTFKCAYGACVDGNKVCNGEVDCADKSDELQLSCHGYIWLQGNYKKCKQEEFQCRNGQCIDQYSTCDGKADCNDKSDETIEQCNREFFQCLQSNFRCAYGACVEGSAKCDGKKDCVDGSDEDDFLCKSKLNGDKGYEQVTQTPYPVIPTPMPNITNLQDKCVVPESIGTKYSLSECENYDNCQAVQPNTVLENTRTLLFLNCKEGFAQPTDIYTFIFCDQGKWKPPKIGCVRLCKPLISTSMKTTCWYEGSVVDCDKGVRPGTTAKSNCQTGYKLVGNSLYLENTCLDKGEWLNPLQRCTHKCGILPSQELISGGVTAQKINHPWNAGVYRQWKNGSITHICGGTLISPFAVLTAAHCVHGISGKVVAASRFKIGLGKEHREYHHQADEESAQHIDVEHVFVSPIYDGPTVHYYSDVAIFELKVASRLTRFVMPACIDVHNTFSLTTNTSITSVVGWGFDGPGGQQTPTLQQANLPFVSYNDCLQQLYKINDPYVLTKDKFCAYYMDRNITTSVWNGDSGSGLMYKYEGRFYVIGIVSTKVQEYVSTFTDTRYQLNTDFINNVNQNITRKHHL